MKEHKNGAGNSAQDDGAKKKKPVTKYRKLRRLFARTPLRAPLVWLRHRDLNPADIFFAAYPKSGTTWARFVLFEMLSGKASGFKATNQEMPGVGLHKNAIKLLPNGGRLVATHEFYRKEYHKSIYMVRDARDVMLSEYAFLNALDFYHEDLPSFVPYFLFTCVSAYGPWHKNVASWLDSPIANTENMMLVRYEDLLEDTQREMTRIAEFLGLNNSAEQIRRAVELSSADNMRKLETAQTNEWATTKESRKDIPFVRSAKSGQWRQSLPAASVNEIESAWGPVMQLLGYPLSNQLPASKSLVQEI